VSSTQGIAILPTYSLSAPSTSGSWLGSDAPSLNGETLWRSNMTVDTQLLARAELWLAAKTNESAASQGAQNSQATREGHRATQKFVCNYLRYDQMVRNEAEQDAEVILYDCVLRSGVVPNLGATPAATSLPDPLADWELGTVNDLGPGTQAVYPGNRRIESVGTTPFKSTLFTKLYKVRKVTKMTLASGEVHHHIVTVKPRNMFDSQTALAKDKVTPLFASSSMGAVIPGLTGFTIIVAAGSIMNKGLSSANNEVGLSKPSLSMVTTCTGSFSNFTRERRWHLAFDNLYTGNDMVGIQDDQGIVRGDNSTANNG
jgi:hypothetical protein